MEPSTLTQEEKDFVKPWHRGCRFVSSAPHMGVLPDPVFPEIAFAGRSNVGKSSLINGLTDQKGLAKSSNTPGRTQALNFFLLDQRYYLVDMPGYGYAKAPKNVSHTWQQLMLTYLTRRSTLKRVYLLVDCRHGLKPNDIQMMDLLDGMGLSYQVILTKSDKVSASHLEEVKKSVKQQEAAHGAFHPWVLDVSSTKKQGLHDVRMAIMACLTDQPLPVPNTVLSPKDNEFI